MEKFLKALKELMDEYDTRRKQQEQEEQDKRGDSEEFIMICQSCEDPMPYKRDWMKKHLERFPDHKNYTVMKKEDYIK